MLSSMKQVDEKVAKTPEIISIVFKKKNEKNTKKNPPHVSSEHKKNFIHMF